MQAVRYHYGLQTRRRFYPVLLLLLLALSAASPAVLAEPDPVTITYMVLANDQEYVVMSKIVEAFEKANPDIKVEIQWPPDYYTHLRVRHASGTAPDVMRIVIEEFRGLADMGVFLDIAPYVDRLRASDPDFDEQWHDYFPHLVDAFRYEDKLYGLPVDWNDTLVFYNPRLFDEAGVAYPWEDWTVEDFIDLARKLTRRDDGEVTQWGYTTGLTDLFVGLAPWVYTHGGKILSDDWTRVELDQPEAIAGLTFMRDLIHGYEVHPSFPWLFAEGTWAGELFIQERTAMTQDGRWDVPMIREGNPTMEFDVQHQPIGPNGHRGIPFGAASLSISRDTKHPEEALRFVAFVTGPEGQALQNELGSSLPVLKSIITSPEFREPTKPPYNQWRFAQAVEYARLIPSPPQFRDLAPVIDQELYQMLILEQTPEQAAENIKTRGDAILQEGN